MHITKGLAASIAAAVLASCGVSADDTEAESEATIDLSCDDAGSDRAAYASLEGSLGTFSVASSGDDAQCLRGPEPEVQIVSIYQSRADHSFDYRPVGTSLVRLDRPGPQVLVLFSYEPTHWKITLAPHTELEAVLALGFHDQTVELPPGSDARVETFINDRNYGASSACGPFIMPTRQCQAEAIVRWAGGYTGYPVRSFRNCYDGRSFLITSNLGTLANCQGDLMAKLFLDPRPAADQ